MTIIELPSPLKVDIPGINPEEWGEDEDKGAAKKCGTCEAQIKIVSKNILVTYVSRIVSRCGCGTTTSVKQACASVSHIKKV